MIISDLLPHPQFCNTTNNNCTLNFNPMDKLLEVIEENKKLYERLLQAEREKIELLKVKG